MISNGTIITYSGTWPHGLFSSADEVVRRVSANLVGDGLPFRTTPQVDASITTTLGGDFGVSVQIEIQNGLGFDTIDDIISIIRHEVYAITGKFPTSDSIPKVGNQSTGQPSDNTTKKQTGCISGTNNALDGSFSIGCWFDNLTTKGFTTVGVLTLIAVAGLALFFVYGPRTVRVTS